MGSLSDSLKRALLRMNRLVGTLERRNIVTYQDKIRLCSSRYNKTILFDQHGNDRIAGLLAAKNPLMISRLGSVELAALRFYLQKRSATGRRYGAGIKASMANNAGFFPVDDDSLDAFCEFFLGHVANADVMAVWFNNYEETICNSRCPDAELVDLTCLEPFHFERPWSRNLAGRRVLVVHPFAESITKQYREKRRLLFPSPEVLPEFELKTVKAVQSIAGTKVGFPTWFDAYRHMCDRIASVDFDVCLIGAGAYGLPLASFAKSIGRQAVHMGGVTQILFGIKGKRWEALYADTTAQLFNEHWVRPLPSETPESSGAVENGCYW